MKPITILLMDRFHRGKVQISTIKLMRLGLTGKQAFHLNKMFVAPILFLCLVLLSFSPSLSSAGTWQPRFIIDSPIQDQFSCNPLKPGPGCECPPMNTVNLPFDVSYPSFPITREQNNISSSLRVHGSFGDFYITDASCSLNGLINNNTVDFTLEVTGHVTNDILPELFDPLGSITIRYAVKDAVINNNNITGRFESDIQVKTDPANCVDMKVIQIASGDVVIKEESLNVEIIGPPTVVIYNPVSKSPKIKLDAIASPSGGKYQWEILSGQDKIKFTGKTNSKTVTVQAKAPSHTQNDVVIKVTYTVKSPSCEDTHFITVQKPTSLKVVSGYPKAEVKKNQAGQVVDYIFIYKFQVYDQLTPDNLINYAGMEAKEEMRLVCTNQRLTGAIKGNKVTTDELGSFKDSLKPPTYKVPIPVDLLLKVQQKIFVAGWLVSSRCQTYYYDHATSEEGICTPCK